MKLSLSDAHKMVQAAYKLGKKDWCAIYVTTADCFSLTCTGKDIDLPIDETTQEQLNAAWLDFIKE